VIVLAVRWHLRFGLCYRDVEELLAECGIDVDHVTVHRWVQRFTPLLAEATRFGRPSSSSDNADHHCPRGGRATCAHGLKCLCLVTRSLDPTCKGRARW
jgi:hypothetical protein